MKLRVLGGLSPSPMLEPLGPADEAESSRKGERGEVGEILGDGVLAGSGSAGGTGTEVVRFLGSAAAKVAEGDSARSGNQDDPEPLERCETSAVAASTCGVASIAGDSTRLAGLCEAMEAPALDGLEVSPGVPGAAGGVKPILMIGSVFAASRLLRWLLVGS